MQIPLLMFLFKFYFKNFIWYVLLVEFIQTTTILEYYLKSLFIDTKSLRRVAG